MNFNWKLDGTEWGKVFKGGVIAGLGAVLTFIASNVGEMDFGSNTPFIVALISIGVNYLRKATGVGNSKTTS